MRDCFIATLTELAGKDPRLMLITGDLGFGVLDKFEKKFPKQYLNAGVAEQNMTGIASGLGLEGWTVFTYSIANFPILRCLEQIRNDAAYHDVNVNIASIGGGFSYGALGFSHHATEDLAIMRALPNVCVVAPSDLWEVSEATKALASSHGVGYLRLDKSHAKTDTPNEKFILGKARKLREGNHLTLICCGGIMEETLVAADQIKKDGFNCRVLSMHTIKPIDEEAIRSACYETGGILTTEEHSIVGGLGSSVSEVILEGGFDCSVFYRIGLRKGFSTIVGSQKHLMKVYEMDADAIYKQALSLIKKKGT